MISSTARLIIIIVVVIVMTGMGATGIYFAAKEMASKCSADLVYDKDQKKCRIKCEEGQTYYPSTDECLYCEPGLERTKRIIEEQATAQKPANFLISSVGNSTACSILPSEDRPGTIFGSTFSSEARNF